jgi:formylglycine-generating enzyme required for sulfatase activity
LLQGLAQDNPNSQEDDVMRTQARERVAYWQKEETRQSEAARRCQASGCTNSKASGSNYCVEHKCQKCSERAMENGLCSQHQPPKQSVPDGFTYLGEKTYTCGGQSYTVKEYRHNQTGMEFVLIPGGTFEMGDNELADWSKPVHTVTIRPFLMSKHETTQAVWQKIMQSDPSNFKGDNRPVEQVSWNDCQEFCKKTGLQLPSEAQWEYACRSGTTGKWYFGDSESQLSEYGWYGSNSGSQTHDVGGKQPNAFGLYDMSGNVWEWCQDWWHDNYNGAPGDERVWDIPTGSNRVFRGGSMDHIPSYCRSAYRNNTWPDDTGNNLGFRAVSPIKAGR